MNVGGTRNLVDAMGRLNRAGRLAYTSSISICGDTSSEWPACEELHGRFLELADPLESIAATCSAAADGADVDAMLAVLDELDAGSRLLDSSLVRDRCRQPRIRSKRSETGVSHCETRSGVLISAMIELHAKRTCLPTHGTVGERRLCGEILWLSRRQK